jgi:cobalt-zinc-cadmium efflux system protein
MHSHGHADSRCHAGNTGTILKWSFAATLAFVAVEVAAGIEAGSLALLSDAGHNITDAMALLFAWLACYLQAKPADDVKTYGYHRTGVLAAFVNAVILVALSFWIFYESFHRFRNPEPVREIIMLWVAGLGLLLNAGIMWSLRSAREHDINVRSAYAHMLGDALGSIGIVFGAITIRYTGWLWIDPALSVAIGVLIIWTAWDIVHESLNILLEGLPRGIELKQVIAGISEIPGVLDVHDLHIWSLGSSTHALSCHVLIEDLPPSASNQILGSLNEMLSERFSIRHTTIQFEHVGCALSENGCVIPAEEAGHHHPHHH